MSQLHTKPQTQHNNTHPHLIFETVNDFIIYSLKKNLGIDLNHQNENDINHKPNDINQSEIHNAEDENSNNYKLNQNENDNNTKPNDINDKPNNMNHKPNDINKHEIHMHSAEKKENSNNNQSHPSLCIGLLKCFYNEKQYGFIKYEHKDLFFHESDFINIKPNEITHIVTQSVSFNIETYLDKKTQTIKRKAINVNVINKSITNINQSKGIHRGTLLWFDPRKKFGFIQCETEHINVFVYESELKFTAESMHKGTNLQFDIEVYVDNFGKTKKKAVNVDIDIDVEENKRGMYKGTLLWFHGKQKFGFIECEPDNSGIFVHDSELKFDRQLIHHGMALQFDIDFDYVDNYGKNKYKAINVDIDDMDVSDV